MRLRYSGKYYAVPAMCIYLEQATNLFWWQGADSKDRDNVVLLEEDLNMYHLHSTEYVILLPIMLSTQYLSTT